VLLVLAVRPPLPLPSSSLDPCLQQPILVAFLGTGPAARPYIAVYVCAMRLYREGRTSKGRQGQMHSLLSFLALFR